MDPEVGAAVGNAASLLESAGATVEPIAPIITRGMLEGLDHFWRARSAADIAALPPERQEKVLPDIRRWVSTAADLTGIDVVNGFNQTIALATAVDTAFASYDFIVSPVAPITAFAAELGYPTDDPMKPFEHIAFTVPYNMSAHPAASVNCGYSSTGLPIGLQIASTTLPRPFRTPVGRVHRVPNIPPPLADRVDPSPYSGFCRRLRWNRETTIAHGSHLRE